MNPNESLEQPHALESVPTETLDSNQLRREVWSESEIPFAVAERIVIERLKAEAKKNNLEKLESIALEVKNGYEGLESFYVFWIGSNHRGHKRTIEETVAAAIKSPEQKRVEAIAAAKEKLTEAQAELVKLTAETKSEGAD